MISPVFQLALEDVMRQAFRESLLPKTILAHHLWDGLVSFVSIEHGNAHTRLELRGLGREMTAEALAITVKCAECGKAISPVRHRKAPNKRSEHVGHGLYLSVACPLDVSIGCSRGKAAKRETAAIRAAVEAWQEAVEPRSETA